jgi:hypothetical protein
LALRNEILPSSHPPCDGFLRVSVPSALIAKFPGVGYGGAILVQKMEDPPCVSVHLSIVSTGLREVRPEDA